MRFGYEKMPEAPDISRRQAATETGGSSPPGSPWREPGVLLLAAVLLPVTYYYASPDWVPARYQLFWWFSLSFACLFLVPVFIIRYLWREPLYAYGLGYGEPRVWLRYAIVYAAIMLPVLVVVSRTPQFQDFYPRYHWARQSAVAFLFSEGGWLVYFLAWEFFFRGFLLFTMLRRYPPALAIAVQTLPFVLMHLPKPQAEAMSSVVAGVALGLMAYRGRSVLGPWLLHFSCAALLDFLVIVWQR